MYTETEGRPDRSRRQIEFFNHTWGFSDELRAALQIDGHTWGFVALFRSEGASPFTPAEQSFVASIPRRSPVGSAPVWSAVRPRPSVSPTGRR